jgi:hypothetical protein
VRAVAAVLVLALPAGADVELGGRPALRLSAGYDDNLFLDAQQSGPTQIRADAIFDIEPRLLGWLESQRHLLTLDAQYLERLTLSNGDLRDAALALGWRSPHFGPIWFSLVGRYEHYATSAYPEDTFDLGGVDAGLTLQLHWRVALEALYRFAARAYPDPLRNGQLDLDQRAHGALRVRAARWAQLEAAYTFVHIGSSYPEASLERHRVELSFEATPLPWLTIAASYAVAPQHLPSGDLGTTMGNLAACPSDNYGPRDDLLQWFDSSITARPLRWLELFARYQLLDAHSNNSLCGDYHRNQVLAGVALHWDFVGQFSSRPLLPSINNKRTDRAVTFHHRAPPGRRVEVVGDWNQWQPQPLVEKSGGLYEGTYIVPPGRHEYGLRVDGQPAEPADAQAYVPDGFGGRSAVLDVQ